jgi:HEAT repeat protein
MAASEQLKALVAQMPDPDARGMYCDGIDKDKIEKAAAQIQQGGRESLLGVIDLLAAPGEGDDVKARYALRCVGVLVGGLEDRRHREEFTAALASQLGGDRPKPVQAFLCEELQFAGTATAVPALGKLLLDEELCDAAAMALSAIGTGAGEQYRAALPKAKGRCRLVIVQNLGVVRDTASAESLRSALDDSDREVRLAAGWALARMGDAGAVDRLVAATASEGWERIQATKHCLLLAEALAAAGKKDLAAKIYGHLKSSRTEAHERYVREAAERGLAAIGS